MSRLDRGAVPKDQWNRLWPSVRGFAHVDVSAEKVFPGTCEACVYGRGPHSETCQSHEVQISQMAERALNYEDPLPPKGLYPGLTTNEEVKQVIDERHSQQEFKNAQKE